MTDHKVAAHTLGAPYVAVITGAAQGIGKRTAEVLASKGFNLVLNDLRQPDQTLENLGNAQSLVVLGDISSEAVVERLRQTIEELRIAMFGIGAANLAELRFSPLLRASGTAER